MTVDEERSADTVTKALKPVFVVGNPRSGTTLVQQILSAHADFWTAPETHLFDHVLLAVPNAATEPIPAEMVHTLLKRMAKRSRLSLAEDVQQALIQQADSGTLTGPRFVELVMRSFKQADDQATRWVEKTPQHLRYLNKIWQYFPDAQVVNVVRDARDVVSSPSRFRKHAPGMGRIYALVNIAKRWNRFIALADRYAGDPRFLSIRYEDLVSDPLRILEQLAAHAGVEKDSSVIERFHEQFEPVTMAIASAENKAFNSAAGLIDRRSVWKKRLTEQEARIIETICGTRMAQHGYQKEYPPSVQASVQIAAVSAIKRMRRTARSLRSLARKVYKPSKPRR
jgi:hypothetical protein